MKEARLILPRFVAPGQNADLMKSVRDTLLDYWGGYTHTQGYGGWRDPEGSDHVELVHIFDIAMDDGSSERARLRDVARKYGVELKQQAVYVRHANGDVEFVAGPGVGEPDSPPPGTKRLPQVGEIWDIECGGRVAVVKRVSMLDGGYDVVLLNRGSAALSAGHAYVVDLDGSVPASGGYTHPLNLTRFIKTFTD